MALTRAQVDTIVARLKGSRDLSAGGVSALKDVLYLVADELTAIQAAPFVLHEADTTLAGAMIAVGNGVTITPDTPTGYLEFKV